MMYNNTFPSLLIFRPGEITKHNANMFSSAQMFFKQPRQKVLLAVDHNHGEHFPSDPPSMIGLKTVDAAN